MADEFRSTMRIDGTPTIDEMRKVIDTARQFATTAAPEVKKLTAQLGVNEDQAQLLTRQYGRMAATMQRNVVKLAMPGYIEQARRAAEVSRQLRTAIHGADRQAQGFGGSLLQMGANLSSVYRGIAQGVAQVQQYAKALYDAGKAGARFADLQKSFVAMGGTADELKSIRDSVQGTVDDATLLRLRNLGVTMGIAKDQIGDLARVAKLSSIATGQSMQWLLESAFVGSARESWKILDNLGIQVKNAQDKVNAEIRRMGLSVETATAAQSKRAVINVALAHASALEAVADLDSQAAAFDRAEASWINFKNELGAGLAEMIISSGAFEGFKGILDDVKATVDDNKDAFIEFAKNTGALVSGLVKLLPLAIKVQEHFNRNNGVLIKALDLFGWLGEKIGALGDWLDGIGAPIDELTTAFEMMVSPITAVTSGLSYLGDMADDWFSAPIHGTNTLLVRTREWADEIKRANDEYAQLAAKGAGPNAAEMGEDVVGRIGYGLPSIGVPEWLQSRYGKIGAGDAWQRRGFFGLTSASDVTPGRSRSRQGAGLGSFFGTIGAGADAYGAGGYGAYGAGSAFLGAFSQEDPGAIARARLSGLVSPLAGAGEGLLSGLSDQLTPWNELVSQIETDAERLERQFERLGDTIESSFVNGFTGAAAGVLAGQQTFSQAIAGFFSDFTDQLANVFIQWAITEKAFLGGAPWLALPAAILMKAASAKLSQFAGKARGGGSASAGGGTSTAVSTTLDRDADRREKEPVTEFHFHNHGIMTRDEIAQEVYEFWDRESRLRSTGAYA